MEDNNQSIADDSIAHRRGRREKKDKSGRFAALERLRKTKEEGVKNKYQDSDEEDIYDEVDEAEYSRIVRQRQEDDWIIDDDGAGYVEDGREIFDEDYNDVDLQENQNKGKKKKQNPNIRAPNSKPKSIKSMFAASAVKSSKPKPQASVNLEDDELLGDIMSELKHTPSQAMAPPPAYKKKPSKASNPFSVKATPPSVKRLNPVRIRPPPPESHTPEVIPDTEEVIDSTECDTSLPLQPRKTKMKTALDGIDFSALEETVEIEEFTPQSDAGYGSQGDNLHPNTQDMDVSGIDFEENMAEEGVAVSKNYTVSAPNAQHNSEECAMSWSHDSSGGNNNSAPDVVVESGSLPLTCVSDSGEQVLRMYWLDAYEDPYKQPGVVYVFGKVWIESAQTHVSCCVAVRNIERKIYLLPRPFKVNTQTWEPTEEAVKFLDVYKEFEEKVSQKYNIMKFKSKKVVMQYAFEKSEVPAESEYLEVRYPSESGALPGDLRGETFSQVFGSHTSALETFLLERKLKGPCWLDIKLPSASFPCVTWCKVECHVMSPSHVMVTENQAAPPPLTVMALNMRTLTNPKSHHNEVVAVSGLIHQKFHVDKPAPKQQLFHQHFIAVGKSNDCVFPFDFKDQVQKQKRMKVEIMGNERALLGFLLAKIHKADPDVIVGHDIFGFQMDVLLHRLSSNKIPHWSRLGRLKKANMPKLNSHGGKSAAAASATSGRLLCDVQVSAKELVRCKSYDLAELVHQLLKAKVHVQDQEDIRLAYSASRQLLQLLDRTLEDTQYILRLMYDLMVIPLALQITNIAGNIMSRTLLGGRSERNEYLLLHAFYDKQYIVPDKTYGKAKEAPAPSVLDDEHDDMSQAPGGGKKQGRKKAEYAGGLVLEPKKGFYDKFILLLDFNSLYPSIIQEYNICFTTLSRNQKLSGDDITDMMLPDTDVPAGILPTEIRKLVQSRRQVKAMMKDPGLPPETYMQYDIRQKALKLTANSMYGCLGFTFSRFYAKHLAALITGKGREILMKTKELVENMSLEVIYGDTDSIMVNTNSTDIEAVFKLGNKVKHEVNKLYKLLEIDIDGVFKSMLLLKKKKYAALTIAKVGSSYVESKELKGLDIVRRDWCELAKEAGNYVVGEILSGESRESIVENIHTKLREVGEQVKEGTVPIECYYITKQLTKNPEDYPDKKSLPHVQVAMRLNSKGGRKMRAGDTVYYVICQDGSTLSASQRAYHPDEVLRSDSLSIDTKYYLTNQVHPVVSRLCDPIEGTDSALIAECLGLDASSYRQSMHHEDAEEDEALLGQYGVTDEERYRDCDRLNITCAKCKKVLIVDQVFTGAGDFVACALESCPGCKEVLLTPDTLPRIQNTITKCMRMKINKYYQGWLKCEDQTCGARVKKLPLRFYRGHPVCPVCQRGVLHLEYSDHQLYTQLCFYQFMFDCDRAVSRLSTKTEKERAVVALRHYGMKTYYQVLKHHVDKILSQSAYSQVNLSKLFQGLSALK